MDGRDFDDLTRRLATGASRRALLRGLMGGGAGLLAARVRSGIAAPTLVDICHRNRHDGIIARISVNANSVDAHLRHGDFLPAEIDGCCNDGECAVPDGMQCAAAVCSDASCSFVPTLGEACNDGFACTEGDACGAGIDECAGAPNDALCDDALSCTVDQCAPNDDADERGCINQPDHSVCQDGNVCTDNSCAPGATGSDEETGCLTANNSATCDDGNACTGDGQCVEGACAIGAPLDCDDDNPCTDDSCDTVNGCQNTQRENGPIDGGVCWGGTFTPDATHCCATFADCPTLPCTSKSCEGGVCTYDNTCTAPTPDCQTATCITNSDGSSSCDIDTDCGSHPRGLRNGDLCDFGCQCSSQKCAAGSVGDDPRCQGGGMGGSGEPFCPPS